MKFRKRVLSIVLSALMIIGALPVSSIASATAKVKSSTVICGDLTFVVPEVIYLTPNGTSFKDETSSTFQWYVNNTATGDVDSTYYTSSTTGKIYYSLGGNSSTASNATLSYSFYDETLTNALTGNIKFSSISIPNGGSIDITDGTSPVLAASTNGCYIRWCIKFVDPADKTAKRAYAYTYVYKPYVVPVAAGADGGTGASSKYANWAGAVTWISGTYGIERNSVGDLATDWDEEYNYKYLNYTNFSAFISPSNAALIGSDTVYGSQKHSSVGDYKYTTEGATQWYASFANSSSYGMYLETLSNNATWGYFGSSSFGVPNFTSAKYWKNDKNISACVRGQYQGLITIDTSRYSNLKDIPNLAIGLIVTDDQQSGSNTGTWYIGDHSETSLNGDYSTWHQNSDNRSNYYNDVDYKIAGQGTSATDTNYWEAEGTRYLGAWPRTLLGSTTSQGANYDYMVKSFYGNEDGGYYAMSHTVVDLKATYYNKANLRAAVNAAINAMGKLGVNGIDSDGYLTSCYFDADDNYKWATFQSAYKEAVIALTKLSSTANPDTLATNLNNALASLQTYYILDGNGGTISGNAYGYVEVGTNQKGSFTVTSTASRTGYLLLGWSTDKNATTASTNVTVGYNNTVYAIWSPVQYSVIYNANGGTGSMNASVLTYDTEASLSANTFTREGYSFVGWNTDSSATTALYTDGQTVVNLSSTQGGQVNLYAIWSKNTYTITYNTYGGSEVPAASVLYGDAIPSATSTRTGYTFSGWTYTTSGGQTYYGTSMPGSDLTAAAVWYKNLHHITYDTRGGTSVADADVYFSQKLPSVTTSKTGYTFTGWSYTGNGTEYTGTTMPDYDLTATAEFTINQHTITYDTNGGDAVSAATVDYGSSIPSVTPTRTGYTFAGWTYTGNGSTYAGATMPDYDLTATASWNINSYTVTYDTDGGSAVSSVTLNYGAALPNVTTSKTGSTFTGWTYTGNGAAYTGSTMPDYDLTAKANFSVNSHTITFNTDGGTSIASITQDYGTSITKPTDPVKSGYDFNGWDQTIPDTMPDEDLYITANWTIHRYTVSFNMNGGTPQAASVRAEYGDTVSVPEYETDFTREGYTFGGWYETSDFSGDEIDGDYIVPAQSTNNAHITLYAKWSINEYSIAFDSKGGSYVDTVTQDYGTVVIAPSDPVRTGYTFGGWYEDESCTGTPYTFTTMPADDIILYAKWTQASYTITYMLDSSDTEPYQVSTYSYDDTVTAVSDPSMTGYTFGGWYENSSCTGSQYTFSKMPARNVILYAKWTVNSHKITFGNTGDTVMQEITLNYNDTIPAIADPVREGYTFTGWNTEIPEKMPDNDIYLVGSWQVNTYHIYYFADSSDAEPSATAEYAYGANVSAISDPTRTGYSFNGWYENSDYSGSAYEFTTMPAHDVTLYAKFGVNSYTIRYKLESSDSDVYDTVTLAYGQDITVPEIPEKTGYSFVQWNYRNAENNNPYYGTTVPEYNLIAVAQWNVEQYTITFENTGDTTITPITQNYGTIITAPPDPTRAGYTFDGWNTDIPETMPAGDMTINGNWTIHTYTVDFDMGGAAPQASSVTAEYNSQINTPVYGTDFSYTGYSFDGWYDADNNLAGSVYTLPALTNNGAHITLYAKWTVNSHTISFVTNSDSVIDSKTADYGEEVTAPDAPVKTGYDFAGWYENESLTGSRYSFPSSMPDRDVTLYAKWNPHNYTVVFLQPDNYSTYESKFDSDISFNSNESFETMYVYYNSSFGSVPVSTPDIAYYNFVKWVDEDGNEVTADTIMPAVDGEIYYIRPVYEKTPINITNLTDGPVIVSSDMESITGYIFNAGDQKTKAEIQSMFDSTGYSYVTVTPSKGKYCGTGTKIEIIDKETDLPVETYYLVIFGDVNGDGICKAADLSICNSMVTAESRTWFVKDSLANSAELRSCYELAADVNGDGIFNSYDTTHMELYTIGLYSYTFDEQEDSASYHKYVACDIA